MIEEISKKTAALSQTYASFRPEFEGKLLSENDILQRFKNEPNPSRRQKVWKPLNVSAMLPAPQILELVALRNQEAKSLGYADFFQMKLDASEVDEEWLISHV